MSSSTASEDQETLYDLLYACQRGQRVAIVGSHSDENALRNGLYVEQKEDKEVNEFFDDSDAEDGRLLILTGSAGDGKSALLARGYAQSAEAIPSSRVNMDATEARRRDGDYSDRLTSFFEEIAEDMVEEEGPRSAIAINYGLAVDYFERQNNPDRYRPIWEAMQASQTKRVHRSDRHNITVINLSHRNPYETAPDALGAGLVSDLIDRFDPSEDESPFQAAFEHETSECPAGDRCTLQYNLRQLTKPAVKAQLARLFAGWSIVTGSYLNPRTIIDNLASLLLPTNLQDLPETENCPVGAAIDEGSFNPTAEDLIWNATFETLGTSQQSGAGQIDPASHTTFAVDQKALQWGTNPEELDVDSPLPPNVEFSDQVARVRTRLRREYLTRQDGQTILDERTFEDFTAALTFFNEGLPQEHRDRAQQVLATAQEALGGWTGRQSDDGLVEFVGGKRSATYRYLAEWEDPQFDPAESELKTQELAVPGRIKLMAKTPSGMDDLIPIPISFEMYRLMTQISEGYTPNATDLNQSHAIRVLHSRLEDFTKKNERIVIESRSTDTNIEIKDADLGLQISSEGIE